MTAEMNARADRVSAIAGCVGGRIIRQTGDTVRVEIPAEKAPG